MVVANCTTNGLDKPRDYETDAGRENCGGVEKPCTMPENTSAFIALKPRKFIDIANTVKTAIAA